MKKLQGFITQYWWALIIAVIIIAGLAALAAALGGKEKEEEPVIPTLNSYDWKEIVVHNQRNDCWLVLDNFIYDVSDWQHPTGADLNEACGKLDAKDYFEPDGSDCPPVELNIGVHFAIIGSTPREQAPICPTNSG